MPNIEAVWNDIRMDIQEPITNHGVTLTRANAYNFEESNNIVTKFYKLEECNESRNAVCSICLESICDGKLKCKHYFHDICIRKWFKNNDTCPYCRNSNVCLVPPSYSLA